MTWMTQGLGLLTVITILMILVVVLPAGRSHGRGWRLVAFAVLFVLPLVITGMGLGAHLDKAKSTEFCLSCHVMEPYGRSLKIDDADFVPANHFQNRRIDRDQACYTCHTKYAMFGDLETKIGGLKHLWVYYGGEMPEKLELYQPYNNRECLHCHRGARSYAENDMHLDMLGELESGEVSCLDCHDLMHEVEDLEEQTFWTEEGP